MDYVVGRKIPLPRLTVTPFGVSASPSQDFLAVITLQGVHVFVSCFQSVPKFLFILSALLLSVSHVFCIDITDLVFESHTNGTLAAFGDFNSDKLTDTFVISPDRKAFSILLAYSEPPHLREQHLSCSFKKGAVASLVPGDFDGDGAMDVLVLTDRKNPGHFDAHIAWGGLTKLDCPLQPVIEHIYGHPLVLDHNGDMIADLFGLDSSQNRTFWIFGPNRTVDRIVSMDSTDPLRIPHSHGYVDLDGDLSADLVLSGRDAYELWRKDSGRFVLDKKVPLPVKDAAFVGQSVFLDVNFDGKLDHLVPVCVDLYCTNSSFFLQDPNGRWSIFDCDLKDPTNGDVWTFYPPEPDRLYLETVTARSGDFNLDGYPDLLITLAHSKRPPRAILLENDAGKKLIPRWDLLTEWNSTGSIASAFYDVQEKGVLDVLVVLKTGVMAAYKNALDYDANFIKVMVLTGRCNANNCSQIHGVPYGTNLAGPSISYRTTHPSQLAVSAQLSQSAYHALQLPYALFGLGRSPNFVEYLKVGLDGAGREWTQIIPNSQMIIIPTLDGRPGSWINKLFVTPSRAIVLSAAALAGFGLLLALVVAVLHCRERRADRLEQLAVANRFHFDAM